MNFDQTSQYDYKGMCAELGIEYNAFIAFINSKQEPLNINSVTETPLPHAIDLFINQQKTLCQLNKISSNTLKIYDGLMSRFKTYIAAQPENYSISKLDEVVFSRFLLECRKDKSRILSDRTQNTYTAILRRFLSYCFTMELTNKDHRHKFTFQPIGLIPRYLQDEHVKAFLGEAKQRRDGYRWHALFSCLLGTGCRVSEIVNIRVCDFDLDSKVLRIYKGKGKKDRTIPLYPQVISILLDYLNLTGLKKWNRNEKGYLFTHGYGSIRDTKLTIRSIERMVRAICNKLQFNENYTVHSFRHTFAIRCLKAGMKIEYLCQILGHTDPKTTFIYL